MGTRIGASTSVQGVDDGDADEPKLAVMVGDGDREPVGVAACEVVADGVPVLESVFEADGDTDCDRVMLKDGDWERVLLGD
jgi:hypothetical protein